MAWIPSLMLMATLLVVPCIVRSQSVCGVVHVWRNNNITCPERAVCADVFETVRDWYNGTRCEEKRILHNCMCAGGSVCPTNDPAYRLFQTDKQQLYTCRPACTLPYCGNLRQRRGPPVAMTTEENAEEFDFGIYNRMDCRCPRHHVPYTETPGYHTSTKKYTSRYNFALRRPETLYVCNVSGDEDQMSDPCDI